MVLDRRSLEVEYCNKVHTGLTKKENLPLHGKESSSSEEVRFRRDFFASRDMAFSKRPDGRDSNSEEPRIAKEVESNYKRLKKEIGKQDVLRRKVTIPLSLLENYRAVVSLIARHGGIVCLCMCVERPREVGAEWMSENIPPDEKIENG
ncbi:hypothetical protein Tco_0479056 [Tanacetum coccineum]